MNRWTTAMALLLAAAPALAMNFEPYQAFPAPAPGAFGVTGIGLPNGKLLLWNGDQLYLQQGVNTDAFSVMAGGYAGDPGFMALAPDGHTVLLGQGYFGNLYVFDVNAPQNFSPASIAGNESHFGGTFLTQNLVLLDAGRADFTGSDLLVVDIGGAKSTPALVIQKPAECYVAQKDVVAEKPPFAYSASLTVDRTQGIVYAMDGNTRELRYFSVAALVQAYTTQTPLDWSVDGVLVGSAGQFYTNGVQGIRPNGDLVIGGSEGFLLPGGIQLVDPRLDNPAQAAVLEVLDPAGDQDFYNVIYNPYTDTITAISGDGTPYAPGNTLVGLPVAGGAGLSVLAGVLALAARRRFRARPEAR